MKRFDRAMVNCRNEIGVVESVLLPTYLVLDNWWYARALTEVTPENESVLVAHQNAVKLLEKIGNNFAAINAYYYGNI